MGLFSNILATIGIGGKDKPNTVPSGPSAIDSAKAAAEAVAKAARDSQGNPVPPNKSATTPEGESPASSAAAPQTAPESHVDVMALLADKAAKSGEKNLDYKNSIVDLLKALGLDSSLTARKELADELGYTGDKADSAKMNVWLIKEVMTRLAANGGNIPKELTH